MPAVNGIVEAAAKAPPLRASMSPVGLKRAATAMPVYAEMVPCDNDTTAFAGDTEDTTSNWAVKVPVFAAARV